MVYEAFDRERNSRVALKTIRIATAEALARFKNEFRALQDLQHPNLVRLDELLEADGTWFFTMELVDGTDFINHVRGDVLVTSRTMATPLAAGSQPERKGERPTPLSADDPTQNTVPSGNLSVRGPALPGTPSLASDGPREPVGFDEARLRLALRQLVLALTAVHDARKVHRDVKPGNILVGHDGRVVLLDFGLITDAFHSEADSQALGTVTFMAPEQLVGEAIGPAADWYAVGTTLYLALTGKRPFVGSADQIAELKQHILPVAPDALVEGVPADLNQLCMDLLAREPRKRPEGREILARLGSEARQRTGPVPRRVPFVGRSEELEALRQAHARAQDGHAVTVLVHGESGMGKSALVKRFVDELAGPNTVLLNGRCYERESVPYKAVDQVIDALARHLAGLARPDVDALLPEKIGMVAEVFPTLRQVAAIDEMAGQIASTSTRSVDPFQTRVAVFAALRDLWTRLGKRRTLVVTIDDLQWADADSLALIAGLMRPPLAPPFLLCATVRTSVEVGALGPRSLRSYVGDDVREIQVGRLPANAAQTLAESLLGSAGRAGALAAEAAGPPLFIEALVRHRLEHPDQSGAVRLDEALVARRDSLGEAAGQLLDVVCVAGGPIQQEVCAHAASVPFGEFVTLVGTLRAANLVRTNGVRRGDSVEPYHDRVRESVVERLPPELKRELHARLGRALEDSGRADAEALAQHFRAGGDGKRAARYAARAAEQAQGALAFERAARLYRTALELDPGPPAQLARLRLGLAEALGNSGRGQEAAQVYLAAAEDAPATAQLDLRWKAAEQLLMSGHTDDGVREMRTVLASIGVKMPETPGRAMVPLVLNRLRLMLRGKTLDIKLRPVEDIPAAELARIDINWSMAVGLAIVDPIRGCDFQTRHMLLALRAGDPYRIACALAAEAGFSAAGGHKTYQRTLWLVERAEQLGAEAGHPNALGYAAFSRAMADYLTGRWRNAIRLCDHAEKMFVERCSGVTWWIDSLQLFALEVLWYLGEVAEVQRRTRAQLEDALARGDLYAATNFQIGVPSVTWLADDDLEGAREHMRTAMSQWSAQGFHIQHEGRLQGEVNAYLYADEAVPAYEYLARSWKQLEKSPIFTVVLARIAGHHARARTALAVAALSSGRERKRLVAEARASARRLVKERAPWAEAFAVLARAGAARMEGNDEAAVEQLDLAIRSFDALDMALYGQLARLRKGELLGGEAGATLVTVANAWMRGQGIVRPERFAAMLAPGF